MNLQYPAILIGALALVTLGGCAAHPDPIIDTQGVNETALAADWAQCEAFTDQIQIERGIAKSAATGAVVGAATGAISGNAGEGAGYGAILGGTRGGLMADRDKQMVFKRCLRGRGYRVLN